VWRQDDIGRRPLDWLRRRLRLLKRLLLRRGRLLRGRLLGVGDATYPQAEQTRERLFQRAVRPPRQGARAAHGMGLGLYIVRRVAEYALAKPAREMLFTVVDQQSRYKAKNVIDTVVYRFGDFSNAWVSSLVQPHGVIGLAIFGVITSALWFPIAWLLGRQYDSERSGEPPGKDAGKFGS